MTTRRGNPTKLGGLAFGIRDVWASPAVAFLSEGPWSMPNYCDVCCFLTLGVQVSNNHMLTQNLYYSSYYPTPKYLIIGYLDPLGEGGGSVIVVAMVVVVSSFSPTLKTQAL